MEPSTPLGSAVASVTSAARRGSNFSRATRIVLSSSNTSFGCMAPRSRCRQFRANRPVVVNSIAARRATPGAGDPRRAAAGLTGQRQRDERTTRQRAPGPRLRFRLECCARPVAGDGHAARSAHQHRARRCLDQGRRQRPARPSPQRLALVERLDREHERPVTAPLVQEPAGLPERVHRGGGPADQNDICARQTELDCDLGRERARSRVREVQGPRPPCDELDVGSDHRPRR